MARRVGRGLAFPAFCALCTRSSSRRYGFHKVNEANRSPKHAPESPPPAWEFSHPRFLRGRPELLADIRRRVRTRSAAVWNPVSVAANRSASP